jgi:hypothetical protein
MLKANTPVNYKQRCYQVKLEIRTLNVSTYCFNRRVGFPVIVCPDTKEEDGNVISWIGGNSSQKSKTLNNNSTLIFIISITVLFSLAIPNATLKD